nr:hypothetical protein DA06_31250 [Georgenia sp. SUBG003]
MHRYDASVPSDPSRLRIAVYAFDGVTMFHLAVPQLVFDEVAHLGLGAWETVLFSDRPGVSHRRGVPHRPDRRPA